MTSIANTAQQRMFFLRQLRKFGVNRKILIQFYRAVTESVLTFWISIWYGSASVHDQKLLVRVASKLTGCVLPSQESICITRTQRRVRRIIFSAQSKMYGVSELAKQELLALKQFLPQSSPDYFISTRSYHIMITWLTQCKPDHSVLSKVAQLSVYTGNSASAFFLTFCLTQWLDL